MASISIVQHCQISTSTLFRGDNKKHVAASPYVFRSVVLTRKQFLLFIASYIAKLLVATIIMINLVIQNAEKVGSSIDSILSLLFIHLYR